MYPKPYISLKPRYNLPVDNPYNPIMGTPKKGSLILGNPPLSVGRVWHNVSPLEGLARHEILPQRVKDNSVLLTILY